MRKSILLSFIILWVSQPLSAQRNVSDSIIGTPWVSVQYSANWTGGDLANRYGFMNQVGFLAGYKTKRNWFYGLESMFMFGNSIGPEFNGIFNHLVDSQGTITDVNGDIGAVLVYARGVYINGAVGKVFPVFSPNKNSGIFVHAGMGYLLHRLRVETQDHVIPQLELDYRKGYDRLTIGPNFHQFVGYAFMANAGVLNFYGGFYFQQGLTWNQRTINFDQPDIPVSKETRLDLQYGVRAGWFIPFYKRQPKEFYYN